MIEEEEHPAVIAARENLEQCRKIEQELNEEYRRTRDAVNEINDTAGEDLLAARIAGDNSATSRTAGEIVRLQTEADLALRAYEAGIYASTRAERDLLLAKADAVDEAANKLLKIIKDRSMKFNEILQSLRDFDEFPYQLVPVPPESLGFKTPQPKTARIAQEYKQMVTRAETLRRQADHLVETSNCDPARLQRTPDANPVETEAI